MYKDIYFVDGGGNADWVIYELVTTNFKGISYDNDPISLAPKDQINGAMATGTWRCGSRCYSVVLRARIRDTSNNYSEPVDITFKCH
ncbi:MAG: hypothetical protein A2W35_08620 [Chloroflexi bacterium RBG_16_57_11]|nr:MAG: hypothetical protein A2W35_08620 [Chloroflexi bacterium RBG_16_57_11]